MQVNGACVNHIFEKKKKTKKLFSVLIFTIFHNSNEHLISAFIGISSYVEYLDLSSNDIMIIDNYSFQVSDQWNCGPILCISISCLFFFSLFFGGQELDRLKTLLLNRNSISFIELDAFSRLTQLKSINLANNRLESFDNRIFEENMQLIDIDLSHNKFMLLSNEPILKSKSLQVSSAK